MSTCHFLPVSGSYGEFPSCKVRSLQVGYRLHGYQRIVSSSSIVMSYRGRANGVNNQLSVECKRKEHTTLRGYRRWIYFYSACTFRIFLPFLSFVHVISSICRTVKRCTQTLCHERHFQIHEKILTATITSFILPFSNLQDNYRSIRKITG